MRATDAAMLILALMLAWSFYQAHKDPANQFNVFDLLLDRGKVSKMAFAFMVTLGVTSWIMIRLTVSGKLTEGYFTAYGLMWVAPLVAKLFSPVSAPAPTEQPPQEVK